MPKNKISEYSTTNSDNSDIEGINISEGCAPSGINNAIRELMVHLKEFQTGSSGDPLTVAGAFVASAGVTANTLTLTGILTASGGTILSSTNTLSGSNIISGNINSSGTTNTFSGGNIFSGTNTISGSAIISGNINSSGTNTFSGSNVMSFGGGTSASPSIYFASDTNTGVFSPAADTVAISTGGSERVRVDSSGNVGIGVTPSGWTSYKALQVGSFGAFADSSTGNIDVSANRYNASGDKYIGTGNATMYRQNTDGNHLWFNAASGTAGNAISFTERMRIDSSGNFYVNNMAVGGTANLHWSSSNGQFFVTSSSRRFKHDITDYDKGLAEVMQMQPKYFVYNEEPSQKQRVGFIAEDFHDLGMTEFVEYWKDENDQDTPSEIGYSNMVAILVKSIQELKAITDAQATRIEALEAEVAVLKGQ